MLRYTPKRRTQEQPSGAILKYVHSYGHVLSSRRTTATGRFFLLRNQINESELSAPFRVVEEWPQIKSIIIWRVVLRVVRRRQGGHFVAVDCIEIEESLHLRGRGGVAVAAVIEVVVEQRSPYLLRHLAGLQMAPLITELKKHRYWAASPDLTKNPDSHSGRREGRRGHTHTNKAFRGSVNRIYITTL